MSTDAIVLLREDHQEVKRVFREFEAAGDNAVATKQRLVDRMIELLTVHTYLENECMYPQVVRCARQCMPCWPDGYWFRSGRS